MLTIEKLKTLFKPQKNSKFYYWGEKPQTGWHTVPLLRTPLCPHSSSSPGGRGSLQPPPCTSGPISMESAPRCRRRTRASFCPKGHPSTLPTCPHLSSDPVRKGHLRSARTWGGGVLPPHATLLTPHTCHPCHLLAHLQPFGKKHLQRHKQGISEITAATQTQTVRHSGHGGGGPSSPRQSCPLKATSPQRPRGDCLPPGGQTPGPSSPK